MQQSRLMSLIESVTNVVVGLALAVATQVVIFPAYGLHLPLWENVQLALLFSGVSLLRGYTLRRLFVQFAGEV